MIQIIIAALRVVGGILLALAGFLSTITGLYFMTRQGARVIGAEGLLLLAGLACAAACSFAAYKLFSGIGRQKPVPVTVPMST
jgi:hypothetical protein